MVVGQDVVVVLLVGVVMWCGRIDVGQWNDVGCGGVIWGGVV